ncbi:MAG: class I SAM-dependent methyltransferase [Methylococcaceae bacterium]|nr:class I SAM-dependent methyltransferase [Methylococcaceae bacterium]
MAFVAAAIYGEALQECVACGGKTIRFWRSKRFQYTESQNQEEFRIYRCARCHTGFLNRPPHRQWLNSIYRYSGQALTRPISLDEVLAREARFPNCKLDAQRMAHQSDQLNESGNKKALDIGSGFGFYTQALRRLGYRTVSINPGQYENEVFKKLTGMEAIPVMIEDFEDAGQFGVVMMSQVLEHLLEPEQAIKKASGLLAPGGILACAVPNFASLAVKLLGTKDNACLWVPEHVNYFTHEGLMALLEQNGFKVIRVEQITRVPYDSLSRRLGLEGKSAYALNSLVKFMQIPIAWMMNYFGVGLYINLYAVKS